LLFVSTAHAQTQPDAAKSAAKTPSPALTDSTTPPASTPAPSPKKSQPEWLAHAYTYSPPGCEFTIQFPEEPFTGQRCDPVEPTKNCSDVTTFTKVYGLDATVTYTVTCKPTPTDMYGKYDDNVMRTVLMGMARPVNLDKSDTGFALFKEAKMAVLLGSGKTDNKQDDLIYTAQLWIGHASTFTLEGQVRGNYVPDADQLFAEILKTAKLKGTATPVDINGKPLPVKSPPAASAHAKTATP
jgi:hypothetical protein